MLSNEGRIGIELGRRFLGADDSLNGAQVTELLALATKVKLECKDALNFDDMAEQDRQLVAPATSEGCVRVLKWKLHPSRRVMSAPDPLLMIDFFMSLQVEAISFVTRATFFAEFPEYDSTTARISLIVMRGDDAKFQVDEHVSPLAGLALGQALVTRGFEALQSCRTHQPYTLPSNLDLDAMRSTLQAAKSVNHSTLDQLLQNGAHALNEEHHTHVALYPHILNALGY